MAACTNNGGSRARRAVTAALVGVLSVGAVPMAAVAAPAAVAEDGIEAMASNDVNAFEEGTADLSLNKNAAGGYDLQANGNNRINDIKVNVIETANGQRIELSGDEVARDYKVEVVTVDESGEYGSVTNEVVNPGTYAVKVTAIDGLYEGGVLYVPFTVKPMELDNLAVYEVNPADALDYRDDEFVYTGSELNLGIKSGTAGLTEGVDYDVKFITPDSGPGNEGVTVKDAGTYYAVVTGRGLYEGKQVTIQTPVVVNPFTLNYSGVEISCDPVVGSDVFPGNPTTVKYTDDDGYVTYLDPSLVKLDIVGHGTNNDVFDELGTYQVDCVPAVAGDKNVLVDSSLTPSTARTTITRYDHAATIEYNNAEFPTNWKTDLSEGRKQNKFNPLLIQAFNNEDEMIDTTVYIYGENGALEAEIKNGTVVQGDFDDWRKSAGIYTVKVVAGDETNFTAGGTATCTVRIVWGTIDANASVYFNYKNDKGQWTAVSSVETTFDSNDVMDRIQTVVKDADGKLLEKDTNYTVTIKDAEGNAVDGIVNAGSYTVEITVKGYDVTGTTTLPVTVAKRSFDDVIKLSRTSFASAGSNYDYLPWRKGGVPVSDMKIDSDVIANFDVTILKDGTEVDEVTDEGVYTLHFEPKTDSVSVNYETPADMEILCAKDGTSGDRVSHVKFVDVTWADHFADAVDWVDDEGYMTGYGKTSTFGGWDKITRADVVGTLYKMAGGDRLHLDDKFYDAVVGWESFDDVDGTQHYGRALAWAKSVGIANGHDGSFRPNDYVTREEFAAFLSNYAELFDPDYEAADSSALDAVSDGDAVSDWFVGAVSWAVENGIMGNAGSVNPSDTIIRGDVAGMIWNYLK